LKTVLALDLGTKTGWAVGRLENDSLLDCGTYRLATDTEIRLQAQQRGDRRLDVRCPRLYSFLEKTYAVHAFDWVVFEDVQFQSSTQQMQLWATWRATVWLFASQHAIQTECVGVKNLKKHASGSGAADKAQMMAALARQDRRFSFVNGKLSFVGNNNLLTDDTCDAVHLLKWAQTTLARAT
jgi:Holliday junction resolvasome RuvABC endonuclease subunit